MLTKCVTCGVPKSDDEFHVRGDSGRRRRACKECLGKKADKYLAKMSENPVWLAAHRAKKAATASRWREAHPDLVEAKRDAYKPRQRQRRIETRKADVRVYMLSAARERAKKRGLPYDLTIDDIIVPERCPVFPWLVLEVASGKQGGLPNSPALDRFVPSLGYVRGNVQVISNRANSLKGDGSLEEHEALVSWMRTK